ncbi:MAG: shikimate kinase [Candidatus Sulfotelmatobacter sp.]
MKKRSVQHVGARKRIRVRRKRPSKTAARVPPNAVFLVGFMGAGKTSVGRALGQRLNSVFEDLDDRIERREGRTIAEIFRDSGEAEFRLAERAALQQVLEELSGGVARIVGLGGGTFAQEQNHRAIQASGIRTVFLDAPLPELWQRCQQSDPDTKRPLQTSANKFRELHKNRLPFYKTASLQVDTEGKQVDAIAAEIVEKLHLKEIVMRSEQGESE